MSLPTFLGIGVPRAGTTWLHELLKAHPDVYVPMRRKEINYFDMYYSRGRKWYGGFFPAEADAALYRAVGEITPFYVYHPECPERIANMGSVTKLIVMLRNPVERAYSWYGTCIRTGAKPGSFESMLTDWPLAIEHGFYSRYLAEYLRYFHREQMLALIFEEATVNVADTKRALARFLDIDDGRFPAEAGERRVNQSYVPRARALYAFMSRVAERDIRRRWNLDWMVNWAKRFGVERLFGDAGPLPPMKQETRQHLTAIYRDEVQELERLLQIGLDAWKL
jgi:hypothetical protein